MSEMWRNFSTDPAWLDFCLFLSPPSSATDQNLIYPKSPRDTGLRTREAICQNKLDVTACHNVVIVEEKATTSVLIQGKTQNYELQTV